MATEQKIEVRKRRAYSAVPDDILTDARLSFAARTILAYALSRPENQVLHVSQLCAELDVSATIWKRARQELQKFGYYVQVRSNGADGKIEWRNMFIDHLSTIGLESRRVKK